jgi:hypothetical protein
MAHSALVDVADAVFRVLNVPTLTAPPPIGAGAKRVVDQPVTSGAQTFPFVWYELAAERSFGGLGEGPWLLEVDLRVHVFSQSNGMQEAQAIIQEAIRLLRLAERSGVLPVTGWASWYAPHDATITLPFELLNGVAVRELVAENRIYLEEVA